MDPLVSILIPAYNSEYWIAETIRSAINQTYVRKEIIVIDDGSSDATFEIAKKFEGNNLKVVQQSNQGASSARNAAYLLCQGSYIQWLDADDILHPDKILNQMNIARCYSSRMTLLSSAWARFYFRIKKAKFIKTCLWQDLQPVEWLVNRMAGGVWIASMAWIVSRELTEKAGLWDTRLSADDDGEYFARIIFNSDFVAFVRDAKSFRRLTASGSLSNSVLFSEKSANSQMNSMFKQIEYLLKLEDTLRTRKAGLTLLQENLIYYYPNMTDAIDKMQKKAEQLGSELKEPIIRWKYSLVKHLLGWKKAQYLQTVFPRFRGMLCRKIDKFFFGLEMS